MQMLIRHANLPDGRKDVDIAVNDGKIVDVRPSILVSAEVEIDAEHCLVSPPFVDAHFHLDSTLTLGNPRINESGTLLEGIAIWGQLKPTLTQEAIRERAIRYLKLAVARGIQSIRTHVDICDPKLLAVDALLQVRREVSDLIDLQIVAFPQDGFLRDANAKSLLTQALDRGVDAIGGIPHFERTTRDGSESISQLCRLAAERGLPIDMHCDENDDPMSRHIETLAQETVRYGLQGRVTASHLTSMHSMDNQYVSKLLPLMAEAEINVVANPLINITLQGRHDSYPRRRGMTRVPELMQHGINTAFGHDCVMDPWYAMGSADMLDVAHMGMHIGQMTDSEGIRSCFSAITTNPAAILELANYGLRPGDNANMVVLQAKDSFEAIRLKAHRIWVIRRGHVIAHSPAIQSKVQWLDEQHIEDFHQSG